MEARRAHNPKAVGSNPTPATNETKRQDSVQWTLPAFLFARLGWTPAPTPNLTNRGSETPILISVSYVHSYAILDYYPQKWALNLNTFGPVLDAEGVRFYGGWLEVYELEIAGSYSARGAGGDAGQGTSAILGHRIH